MSSGPLQEMPHAPARMLPTPKPTNASQLLAPVGSCASRPTHAAPPATPAAAADTIDSDGGNSNTSCSGVGHTVAWGDTCQGLAGRYGTGVEEIQALNPGLNCSGGLRPGQLLCVTANATEGESPGTGRSACVAPSMSQQHCVMAVTATEGVREGGVRGSAH